MSYCFYLKSEKDINLKAVQENLQKCLSNGFMAKLDEYKNEYGGRFYIDKQGVRGIEINRSEDNIEVRICSLSNYADYIVAHIILDMLSTILKVSAIGEDGEAINIDDYFSDEHIKELRQENCKVAFVMLKKAVSTHMEIPGIVRSVYFGKGFVDWVEINKLEENLPAAFDKVMMRVQWDVPDYPRPNAMLIKPPNASEEDKGFKIRMMFKGQDYILNDYDYLLVGDTGKKDEFILINKEDLLLILPQYPVKWEKIDDFTVVAPRLDDISWTEFVEKARKMDRQAELSM